MNGIKKTPKGAEIFKWLGRLDSNQRITESKSVALPLGDAPIHFYSQKLLYLKKKKKSTKIFKNKI